MLDTNVWSQREKQGKKCRKKSLLSTVIRLTVAETMRRYLFPLLFATAGVLTYCTAHAANTASKDEESITGSFIADNRLHTGIKVDTSMDFNSGMAGANFSIYGIARGRGNAGAWGVHDIVGVHGTAIKDGAFWAAGMHCDVYDTVSGGTSICLNVEFPLTQPETSTIGINLQPHPEARGLIGLQLQNPDSFKTGIDMPNMNWIFGDTDGSTFGMRYDKLTQSLKFYRNIGQRYELLVHEIKMDYGQVK